MSVFTDFQKCWSQKFPENSLTSEWKEDVRASLKLHKEKIDSLEKELEKEKLYCIYLEKLLSDAENFKQNDNDSSSLTVLPDSNEPKPSDSVPESSSDDATIKETDAIYLTQVLTELQEKSQSKTSNDEQLKSEAEPASNQYVTVIKLHNDGESTVESEETPKPAENIEKPQPVEAKPAEVKPQTRTHKYENVIIETKTNNNILKQDEPPTTQQSSFTSTFSNITSGSVLATAAAFDNARKKVPPKPPPKFAKRAPVDAPSIPKILPKDGGGENNVKPSLMQRQKSNESLEQSPLVARRSVHSMKSSLEEKNGESVSSTPTGSFGRVSPKSNKSQEKISNAGSKESLGSIGLPSDKLTSYESTSSLNSDGLKTGAGHDNNEHYYDSVPIDNIEDDYVYIKPGSLPQSEPPTSPTEDNQRKQIKSVLEPESPGRNSNYVNIDYFLQSEKADARNSSIESDGEHNDKDSNVIPSAALKKSQVRSTTIRQIISSIINSETLYVDCLNKMKQYMKAIRADLSQSHPVITITQEEFDTMFFKIDELYAVHDEFLTELRTMQSQEGDICAGKAFKKLTDQIDMYGAFLHNYGRAIETVKKCGANNAQFRDIVSKIVLNSPNEQTLTLEDLLHKPVARVQKNALNLQDLLNHTPETHPDYHLLKQSQRKMRSFLAEFNVPASKFMHDDKALRRLVKNSFIVEHSDGHRKLRHLFLFNDVIACAKHKASGRDRFECELKWFIPLQDINVLEDIEAEPKESNLVNLIQLKSQACTVRDQIMMEEKEEKKRSGDKYRKKLADLEGQLVLASPNLVLKLSNKTNGKVVTFFLSSDFERTQWIDSITTLQQSCTLPGTHTINVYDLQAWITACQTHIKTEMGSYLLRSGRDESLLVGDLLFTVQHLTGLEHAADLFICIEVDSYGHYFRKAKTKLVCQSANPMWNESFIIELEGSQNVRLLLYEDDPKRPILRAKHILQLSRQWLSDETPTHKLIKLTDKLTLNVNLKFTPGELSLRRVPTSKPGSLFGSKLQNVLKREKRDIPFIITSCIREVERRGLCEVGVYRVSGSASDLSKLKKSFETNSYEAEQLLKEVDIHSVTGILKSYLRELPEALFTDALYVKLFEAYNKNLKLSEEQRAVALSVLFPELPPSNQATIDFILHHLIRVNQHETENKMSLHNLAMVFGPTLLRPGKTSTSAFKAQKESFLESSTVDVMTQAGILLCFLLNIKNKH
ncbi:active breakpoint cluster region-related protein-like [Culicoides brevitarsis]|uniref:active breakpoint cluster region-related protein-like n=1 Tax=Culicoides brevitarsis TaxID=469753 RepID=UPI00307C25ED